MDDEMEKVNFRSFPFTGETMMEGRKEEIQCRIPFREETSFSLIKAEMTLSPDNQRDIYLTFVVSDDSLDRQGDKMSMRVLEKIVDDAKAGKIRLTRGHEDHFTPGISVDGRLVQTPDGRYEAHITFKALKYGGQFYPEILEIVETYRRSGTVPYQVSVGGWINRYERVLEKDGIYRVITDAEVEHVGIIRQGLAANPRTKLVDVLVKALKEYETRPYEETPEPEESIHIDFEVEEDEDISSVKGMEVMKKSIEDILLEIQKLSVEARRINPLQMDLVKQMERSAQYGISPTPIGLPIKPEMYLNLPDELFADPVNYLFPLTDEYVFGVLEFFHNHPHWLLSVYDLPSARVVYNRTLRKALEKGKVSFPMSATVGLADEELVTQLEGYSPQLYSFYRHLLLKKDEAEREVVAGLWLEIPDKPEEEILKIFEERSKKYKYSPTLNSHVEKHPLLKEITENKFADPVGLNFPVTPEWVFKSYRVFLDPEIRKLYDPEGQKFVFGRILKAFKGLGYKVAFRKDDPLFVLCYDPEVMVGADEEEIENEREKAKEILEKEWNEGTLRVLLSSILEKQEEKEGLEKQEDIPDQTITAADFIGSLPLWVLGLKARKPTSLASVTERHPLRNIAVRDFSAPFVTLMGARKIAQFLGIKDPNLVFGDVEELAMRFVPVDGKSVPIPKTVADEVGKDTPIAKLSIIRKSNEEPILDVYLLKSGRLLEVLHLPSSRPIRFQKDHVPQLSIIRSLERIVSEITGVESPVILELGRFHFVTSLPGTGLTIFPYFIDEDGNLIVENAPKRAMTVYIPDDEDVEERVLASILACFWDDQRVTEEWREFVRSEVEGEMVVPEEPKSEEGEGEKLEVG